MNLFAPSAALLASQPIFAHRQPAPSLPNGAAGGAAVDVLRSLGVGLVEGLRERRVLALPPAEEWLARMVQSRYAPLPQVRRPVGAERSSLSSLTLALCRAGCGE